MLSFKTKMDHKIFDARTSEKNLKFETLNRNDRTGPVWGLIKLVRSFLNWFLKFLCFLSCWFDGKDFKFK